MATNNEVKRLCPKCTRQLSESINFYKRRNGEPVSLCKKCYTMHIDSFDQETFLWALKDLDVPFVPQEWKFELDKAYSRAGGRREKMTGMSVLGRYLSKMKLVQYKDYGWDDTERLQEELKQKQEQFIEENPELKNFEEEVKQRFEKGEISETEYKTFMSASRLEEDKDNFGYGPDRDAYKKDYDSIDFGGGGNMFDEDKFMKEEDLPDIGKDLTKDDKLYLAMKWGRLYQPHEWVSLETLYNEFLDSFDIQGAARLDTLKKICKTSLKMDQAIDCGDLDGYQKLSKVYDALMKSGKFTEAQRKEEKSGDFDCVGLIVNFAESKKGGGKIERHKITTPLDIVDETIDKLKQYYVDLIENDVTIKQLIENWFKKRENQESMDKDLQEAKKQGLDRYLITDQDLIDFREHENEEKEADKQWV